MIRAFEIILNIEQILMVFIKCKLLSHYFSGYDDKFKGVCGMLLENHNLYEGHLKTTGKDINCVLSFNVQESVLTD